MASDDWLEMGRIGSPFGVKGWVRVESYTDPPEGLFDHERWHLRANGKPMPDKRVLEAREQGNGWIARLEDVEDRNAAESLQGTTIHVARSALPALREREYYQADLVGLNVKNGDGIALGVLRQFVDTPGGPVMVVRQENGAEHWIPAGPAHLTKVDLSARQVVVDWPATLE